MEHLRNLISYCKQKDPETKYPRASEELYAHLETVFLPHVLRVIQKENALLSEVEIFPGIKATWWDGSEEAWKHLHMALIYAVLQGNPKEKIGKLIEAAKSLLPGGHSDEVLEILEDEDTQNSIQEIMELVMNTRLASLVGDIVQSIHLDDLDIKFDDPAQLAEMFRNPTEHPVLKEIMDRAKIVLEDRIQSGKLNQQELAREIEIIRAKFQSSFGKYLNELVVGDSGNTTGNTAAQIMSNSPDARRARMLARLQRKQREKAGGKA
jgi:hypothetical protein